MPKCNKSFTKPLVSLNFADSKPVMVTCPHCSEPVKAVVENKKEPSLDAQVEKRKVKTNKTDRLAI